MIYWNDLLHFQSLLSSFSLLFKSNSVQSQRLRKSCLQWITSFRSKRHLELITFAFVLEKTCPSLPILRLLVKMNSVFFTHAKVHQLKESVSCIICWPWEVSLIDIIVPSIFLKRNERGPKDQGRSAIILLYRERFLQSSNIPFLSVVDHEYSHQTKLQLFFWSGTTEGSREQNVLLFFVRDRFPEQ